MMKFFRRPPVNIFVLGTGRTGTSTFIQACHHIENFTAGHETRIREIGDARFSYPDRHIEADNRLSWFLGDIDRRYGKAPLYVHLLRDRENVLASFARRWGTGIMRAFNPGIITRTRPIEESRYLAEFYIDTVTANIEHFLANKPRTMVVWLEDAPQWFPKFWEEIGARGNLQAALAEFGIRYNASNISQREQ